VTINNLQQSVAMHFINKLGWMGTWHPAT